MDTEEYRKKIEEEVLKIIEEKLKSHEMNADRATEIAKYILQSLHPYMDINQIYTVVQNFDDHFPELVPVVVEVTKGYDEKIKKVVIDHVDTLLKQGKVDEATDLLKKAMKREIKIK